MNAVDEKLRALQQAGTPIEVALVGAGQMGTDILAQVQEMVGIRVSVVVDISWERVETALKVSECQADVVYTDELEEADRAFGQERWLEPPMPNWPHPCLQFRSS